MESVGDEERFDDRAANITSRLFRVSLESRGLSSCAHGRERTYAGDCYVLDGHGENVDYDAVKVQV